MQKKLWEELNALRGDNTIPHSGQSDVSWRVEGDVTHTIESRSRGIHIRPLGATASSVWTTTGESCMTCFCWDSLDYRELMCCWVYRIGNIAELCILLFCFVVFSASKRSMKLVGSQSQDMEERLSPSARLVRSPGSQTRIHSIESILGFKGENLFHPAFSYGSGKPGKDTEHLLSPKKDCKNSKNFEGE